MAYRNIPPRISLKGDKFLAQHYISEAESLLAIVKNQAKSQNLKQYNLQKVLPNGVIIQASIVHNIDYINIYYPENIEQKQGYKYSTQHYDWKITKIINGKVLAIDEVTGNFILYDENDENYYLYDYIGKHLLDSTIFTFEGINDFFNNFITTYNGINKSIQIYKFVNGKFQEIDTFKEEDIYFMTTRYEKYLLNCSNEKKYAFLRGGYLILQINKNPYFSQETIMEEVSTRKYIEYADQGLIEQNLAYTLELLKPHIAEITVENQRVPGAIVENHPLSDYRRMISTKQRSFYRFKHAFDRLRIKNDVLIREPNLPVLDKMVDMFNKVEIEEYGDKFLHKIEIENGMMVHTLETIIPEHNKVLILGHQYGVVMSPKTIANSLETGIDGYGNYYVYPNFYARYVPSSKIINNNNIYAPIYTRIYVYYAVIDYIEHYLVINGHLQWIIYTLCRFKLIQSTASFSKGYFLSKYEEDNLIFNYNDTITTSFNLKYIDGLKDIQSIITFVTQNSMFNGIKELECYSICFLGVPLPEMNYDVDAFPSYHDYNLRNALMSLRETSINHYLIYANKNLIKEIKDNNLVNAMISYYKYPSSIIFNYDKVALFFGELYYKNGEEWIKIEDGDYRQEMLDNWGIEDSSRRTPILHTGSSEKFVLFEDLFHPNISSPVPFLEEVYNAKFFRVMNDLWYFNDNNIPIKIYSAEERLNLIACSLNYKTIIINVDNRENKILTIINSSSWKEIYSTSNSKFVISKDGEAILIEHQGVLKYENGEWKLHDYGLSFGIEYEDDNIKVDSTTIKNSNIISKGLKAFCPKRKIIFDAFNKDKDFETVETRGMKVIDFFDIPDAYSKVDGNIENIKEKAILQTKDKIVIIERAKKQYI